MNYLFGYGSLINPQSRLRTAQTGKSFPVRVVGLQRAWNYHNKIRKRNVLGVVFKENATCNGVIIEVSDENLVSFDERESGYKRVQLDIQNIKPFNEEKMEGTFWIYIPKEPQIPSKNSPIQQSYIDVVLQGCLEISEKFTEECIRGVLHWEEAWINDRNKSNYLGAMKNLNIEKIDKLLLKVIPKEFEKRKDVL